MKKKKEMKAFKEEHQGRAADKKRGHENWENAENPVYLRGDVSPLKDIGSLDEIQNRPALQKEVYLTGDLIMFRYFLEHRRCFQREVQRMITIDLNFAALEVFLEFREFESVERKFMIKRATPSVPETMEFLEFYLSRKSLGQEWEEVARDGRFPLDFIRRIWDKMPTKYQKICNSIRHVTDGK